MILMSKELIEIPERLLRCREIAEILTISRSKAYSLVQYWRNCINTNWIISEGEALRFKGIYF